MQAWPASACNMQHAQHAYRMQHACSMQHAYSMQHACNARAAGAAGAAGACMLNVAMPTKFATAECDGRSSMRTITWCIVHRASRSVHLAACIVHLASCISPVLRALCAEGRAGAMRLRSAHEGRAVGHRQQRQQHGLLVHVVPTSGATPPYVGALQSSQVRRMLACRMHWRFGVCCAAFSCTRCLPRAKLCGVCLPRAVHDDTRRLR